MRVSARLAGKKAKCPTCQGAIEFPPIAKASPVGAWQQGGSSAEPLLSTPVAQIAAQPDRPILVVEHTPMASRLRPKSRALFPALSTLVVVFGLGFLLGQHRTFVFLQQQLPQELQLESPLDRLRSLLGPASQPTAVSPAPAIVRRQGSSDAPAQRSTSAPAVSLEPSGNPHPETTDETTDEPTRTGWGNGFELLSIHAEPTQQVGQQLPFAWHVEIQNKKPKPMDLSFTVKLLKGNQETLGISPSVTGTLAPREIKKFSGEIPIDPTQESEVESVIAHVRSL
jgi:hypothetical protein